MTTTNTLALVILLLCASCRLGYKHPDAATDAVVDASDAEDAE